jgi:hypothetical protein
MTKGTCQTQGQVYATFGTIEGRCRCPQALPQGANLQGKRFVFKSQATGKCLSLAGGQRLLNIPRVQLEYCNPGDSTQGYTVRPAGSDYQIVDSTGKCLTTYSGMLLTGVVAMPCDGQPDKMWAVTSLTPGGKVHARVFFQGVGCFYFPYLAACLPGLELVRRRSQGQHSKPPTPPKKKPVPCRAPSCSRPRAAACALLTQQAT